MKYFFQYNRYNIPRHVFEQEYIDEASLKVLEYVVAKDVQTIVDMPGLPLILTSEVREILPKEVAKCYRSIRVKGAHYWRVYSLYDDIHRVKVDDEYEVLEGTQVVW